jgi:CysZ protein
VTALRVLRRAWTMLRRERSLWPWVLVPFALNLVAFGLAAAAFVANLDAIAGPLERMLAVSAPEHWYGYLWAWPLWLLAALVRLVLLVAFGVAIYFAFTAIGGVVAAPFLDVLSERVERLARGTLPPQAPGMAAVLRRAGRSLVEEGKRVAFLLALQAVLLLVGLVPGLQPFAAAASLAVAALFLPLVYTGFALDRRGVRFAARRRWVVGHPFESLAFGGIALAVFLVPGLSFFCLPWLVTAGTLFVLELWPEAPPAP